MKMKVPYESAHVAVGSFDYRSSRLRVIGSSEPVTFKFVGLVFRTMVFFNDDVLIFFMALLQGNQQWRLQQ
jgi:hypothetical protein